LPERLDWVFQDYMSPQQINDLASSSPDNEQQVNLFVTGPTLYARFGAATRGQFDLRYGNSYAEENDDFNGDRYSAAARVLHDLDATSAISGNLEAADVEYDDSAQTSDYKRYDAYVGYKRKGPSSVSTRTWATRGWTGAPARITTMIPSFASRPTGAFPRAACCA
jgi:hypothetical protein